MEKREHLYTVGWNVNWYSHSLWKTVMEVPQGIKNRTSNPTSMYISKGKETIIWKTYLYCHVHCSIIHNSQGMETTKYFSIDEWIKKMLYIFFFLCRLVTVHSLKKKNLLQAKLSNSGKKHTQNY